MLPDVHHQYEGPNTTSLCPLRDRGTPRHLGSWVEGLEKIPNEISQSVLMGRPAVSWQSEMLEHSKALFTTLTTPLCAIKLFKIVFSAEDTLALGTPVPQWAKVRWVSSPILVVDICQHVVAKFFFLGLCIMWSQPKLLHRQIFIHDNHSLHKKKLLYAYFETHWVISVSIVCWLTEVHDYLFSHQHCLFAVIASIIF